MSRELPFRHKLTAIFRNGWIGGCGAAVLLVACSAADGETPDGDGATGGAFATGGAVNTGGGGSGGSGTGGAATTGGSSGTGGATVFDCSSLPLCTDFESDAEGSVPTGFTAQLDYGNNGPADRVAVTQEDAHGGTRSVKVNGGASGLWGLNYAPTTSAFYLRTWLKLADYSSGQPVILGVGTDSGSEVRMRLKGPGSTRFVAANAAQGDGLSPVETSGSGPCNDCVVPPSDWFCFEMYVDTATQTLQFWVDGQQVVDVVNNAPWHSSATWPAALSTLRIGSMALEGGGATVYIDDMAVGPTRIPCE